MTEYSKVLIEILKPSLKDVAYLKKLCDKLKWTGRVRRLYGTKIFDIKFEKKNLPDAKLHAINVCDLIQACLKKKPRLEIRSYYSEWR